MKIFDLKQFLLYSVKRFQYLGFKKLMSKHHNIFDFTFKTDYWLSRQNRKALDHLKNVNQSIYSPLPKNQGGS